MKLLLRILAGLALVVLLAVAGTMLFLDSLAREAVERGGTFALGVPTELESADIGIFSGDLGLAGLRVANPPGFSRPDFFSLGKAQLESSLGSLLGDAVTVSLLELQGIALDLERNKSGTNYGAILDHLSRFESEAEKPQEEGEAGGGKTFLLECLVVRDVTATIDLLPVAGDATRVTLSIPEIVLKDLGSEGMSAAQICALVVKTILSAALQAGADVLPADLLKDLRGRLKGLESVALAISGQTVEEVQGALQEALGTEAEKALKGAGEKLEGLFKKKD